MDADSSSPRNLTQDPAKDVRPAWSPDGRRIAFVSGRDRQSEIYVMNADGSGKRNLTRNRAKDDLPTWSPDGRRIAFVRATRSSRGPLGVIRFWGYELYVVNADGSGLRRLPLNPRSKSVFASASAGLVTGRSDDPLRAPTSSGPTGAGRGCSRTYRRPRRSGRPTGRGSPSRATRGCTAGQSLFRAAMPSHTDIYVMNADGSGIRKLTHNALGNAEPAWSPDGRKIAFGSRSTRNGNRDIYVMNADGSGRRNLTRNAAWDSRPSWSPDGRKIAFVSDRDGRLEAHVMNADGSGQRSLALQER